jgi:hypothetical protein
MEVGRVLSPNLWLYYNEHRVGRFRFYQFDEFFSQGIQFYPFAHLHELKRSWRITKKLLKTRSKPKARMGMEGERQGIFIYRLPRIVGEEFLTKRLNATKFTSEKVTYL